MMGVNSSIVRKKPGVWCKQDRLSPGLFKLNIDGSVIHGITTGGGIVQDHEGKLIGSFSNYYGDGTNTLAEVMALRDVLLFCLALNILLVLVESDSAVVVKAICSGKIGNCSSNINFKNVRNLFR